jgi:hypothetical protein|tara:strand:- start:301 stop:552 length:252 start_codon:yes stop_codon:yes gene_type:complete
MNNVENVYFKERDFTEVCKKGFINNDPVSKLQMIDFIKNGFTIRHINNKDYKIIMPNLEFELLKGIVQRSPLYSDIELEEPKR